MLRVWEQEPFWMICWYVNRNPPCKSVNLNRSDSISCSFSGNSGARVRTSSACVMYSDALIVSFVTAMIINNEIRRSDVESFHRAANVKEQGDYPAWIRFEADSFHLDSRIVIEASFETFDVSLSFKSFVEARIETYYARKKPSHVGRTKKTGNIPSTGRPANYSFVQLILVKAKSKKYR